MEWRRYGKISVLNSSGTEVEASQQFTTKTSSDIDDGWERISYTFASPGTGTYYIGVSAGGFSGSYYVDDIQIDTGALAGSKNLVKRRQAQLNGILGPFPADLRFKLAVGITVRSGRFQDKRRHQHEQARRGERKHKREKRRHVHRVGLGQKRRR